MHVNLNGLPSSHDPVRAAAEQVLDREAYQQLVEFRRRAAAKPVGDLAIDGASEEPAGE